MQILGLNGGATPEEKIKNTALASLVIAAVALPGYWVAIPLVDRIGRKPIQMIGFVCVTIIFACMGAFYKQLEQMPTVFFLIYGLSFFFSNFGPNTTTYIVPGEAFPTSALHKVHWLHPRPGSSVSDGFSADIRAACHGISAAMGKLGAIVGVSAFVPVVDKYGIDIAFFGCAVVSILGLLCTIFFVPETKGTSFEVMDEQEANEEEAIAEQDERKPLASSD